MPPSSFTVSLIADRTLFSSVMSQRRATARATEAAQVDDGMLRLASGVAKRDGNVRPRLRQPQGDGPPQASRPARNQDGLAGKWFRDCDPCRGL